MKDRDLGEFNAELIKGDGERLPLAVDTLLKLFVKAIDVRRRELLLMEPKADVLQLARRRERAVDDRRIFPSVLVFDLVRSRLCVAMIYSGVMMSL